MPNPATIDDIEKRWRPLTAQETINAEAFLEDAWWLLTGRRPTLEDDLAVGTVSTGNVVRVVVEMVKRVLRNPEGFEQESIDDWSGRRNALVASGLLTIADSELVDITPLVGRKSVRSIRLVTHGDS